MQVALQKLWPKRSELTYDTAARGLIFMLPMVLALAFGKSSWVVPFGQGGFFFSMMPMLPTRWARFLNMTIMLGVALGFYLIGGNSTTAIGLAVFYAFIVGFVATMMTAWPYMGMGAIAAIVPIYAAGLNAGSPTKAASSFVGFSIILTYCGLITLLPFWKSRPLPAGQKQVSEKTRTLSGIKLGLASAIALFLSEIWDFSKLGWAPSAVGSVVRPEEDSNYARKRAAVRAIGVIVGGFIAAVILAWHPSLKVGALFVVGMAVLNGLIAYTALGQIPILYNAVILLLYTLNSPSHEGFVDIRVLYNLLGIFVALAIVYYPLPRITRKVEQMFAGK